MEVVFNIDDLFSPLKRYYLKAKLKNGTIYFCIKTLKYFSGTFDKKIDNMIK
jgi:hypothetical protein